MSVKNAEVAGVKTGTVRIEIYEGEANVQSEGNTLQLTHIRPDEITVKRISDWLEEFGFTQDLTKIRFAYFFKNKTCLTLRYVDDQYHTNGIPNTLQVAFGEEIHRKSTEPLFMSASREKVYWEVLYTVQSYPLWQLDRAVSCFVERVNSERPSKLSNYYA